jgi:orotate phosphoribosyltransferase
MTTVDRQSLVRLLAAHSYRKGTFRLASGRESDFYVDVKQTVFRADGARAIGQMLCDRLEEHGVTLVGGMAVGAIPLVSVALTAAAERDYALEGFFVRKDVKDHGTAQKIDGRFRADACIALVEDVVTTGASTLAAIEAVAAAGGRVALVVTVVDREENDGVAALEAAGAVVESLATRTEIMAAG